AKAEKHLAALALEIRDLLAPSPRVETRGYQRPSLQDGDGFDEHSALSVPSGPAISSPGFQPGVGLPGPMPTGPLPSGPPLHNLPYPPLGDLFTGRQEDLDALADTETAAITQS